MLDYNFGSDTECHHFRGGLSGFVFTTGFYNHVEQKNWNDIMAYEWFAGLSPITQAFLATCFTWFVTALGAAVVFLFKDVNKRVLDAMLGFAAGVMIAASFWSLLSPAIELAEEMSLPARRSLPVAGLVYRRQHWAAWTSTAQE